MDSLPKIFRPNTLDISPFVLDEGSLDDAAIQKGVGNLETAVALMAAKHILRETLEHPFPF